MLKKTFKSKSYSIFSTDEYIMYRKYLSACDGKSYADFLKSLAPEFAKKFIELHETYGCTDANPVELPIETQLQ